jgi:hypothetical protein
MVTRRNKPEIFQIGTVVDDGRTITVTKWGVGPCARCCPCHRNPATGGLLLLQNNSSGSLGVTSFGPPCSCCEPWSYSELAGFLRDLDRIQSLTTVEGQPT